MLTNAAQHAQDSAGFMYSRVVCPVEGRLFVRPLVPDLKGATMLRYDKPQMVSVADTAIYCFPIDWTSVEWIANTRKIVKMYLYASPEEAPIDSFKFDLQDSVRRVLTWSQPEMKTLRSLATGALLFARFDCSKDEFKLTPQSLPKGCATNAVRLRPGRATTTGKSQILSLYYADIEGYPLEFRCVNNIVSNLQNLFIADTCEFALRWDTNATKKRCVYHKQTARGGETWTISSEEIAGWPEKLTPRDGFYYVRTTADGTITLITNKPEELDPEGDDPEDEPGEGGTTTGWWIVKPEIDCKKVMHNGQIIIIRAGKAYSITGQALKIE